jgi:hypothetical protein
MTEERELAWTVSFARAASDLSRWRRAHPRATFSEIEAARDELLRPVMAQVTADVSVDVPEEELRRCPVCAGHVRSSGKRSRELLGEGSLRVRLDRQYMSCAACGWAGFPPR